MKATYKLQYTENGINVPSFVRRISLCSQADLCGHSKLELVICHFEERKEFTDKDTNVAFVDECI